MRLIGTKLYYADGTIRTISLARLVADWATLPATDLQVVVLFFQETYQIWQNDGYDASGQPINPRLETEHYRVEFHSDRIGTLQFAADGEVSVTYRDSGRSADVFWFDPVTQTVGVGTALDVPGGLPIGAIKTGALLADDAWKAIYEASHRDRRFP